MCGISGRVAFEGNLHTEQPELAMMTDPMARRGPDDEGMWLSDHAMLGHRRLSVIDPEGGHQPMEAETSLGSVALTYNGEVYNAPELRHELEARGHTFRDRSDTEVILNGYMEWGKGVAEKLRGMFAFAIWDDREQKLIMSRDPVGVKPLSYYPTQDGILFGSEPKAILAHPLARSAVRISGLRELLSHVKTPGSLLWEGMQEVKPGSTVTVDRSGIREQSYWQLHSHEHEDNSHETIARVRELLQRIIREQLVADVPVSILLSGGLDSSAITALAAQVYGKRIISHVIDFIDHDKYLSSADVLQANRDAPFAQEIAALWNTDHTRIEFDPVQLAYEGLRERAIQARDIPMGSGDGDTSRLLLFEKVRERSTVALSGEMADELFGGYVIFSDPQVLQNNGWPWHVRNPQELSDRLALFNPDIRTALDMDAFMADSYTTAVSSVERIAGESALEHRRREINYLEITRHAGHLLDYTDRLSMASGLEVRVPYCDQELIDYVYNVPWSMKAPDGDAKGLLKAAVSDLLSPSVLSRPKSPYPQVPHPAYLREIQRQGQALTATPAHPIFELIDRRRLEQMITKPIGQLTQQDRQGINLALDLAVWHDLYRPAIAI